MTDRDQPTDIRNKTNFDYDYEDQLNQIEKDIYPVTVDSNTHNSHRHDMIELKTLETIDNDWTQTKEHTFTDLSTNNKMILEPAEHQFTAIGHVS